MAHANGKLILLGEHAVVYGVPALAAGIHLGARAEATPSERLELTLGDVCVALPDETDLGRAFAALCEALGAKQQAVKVSLEIPAGSGLGASAAIGVAIARALLEASGSASADALVLAAASAWERVFHGNPSGIDVAAALSGGCIYFTREAGAVPVELARPLEFAVALAGPPASTKLMVDSVARLKERRPELVRKTLEGIRSLVDNARLCLNAGDLPGLGKLLDLNQMLLSGLFLSSDEIEYACHVAREAGALGAKLTGAGGGGAVIALADGSAEPLLAAFERAGIQSFAARVEPQP